MAIFKMSFTFPFKKSFLWHDIFTSLGSTLWFATVIIANSGDMLHLVKIYFHIFYAFQLFCDNLLFRFSHNLLKPYLLFNWIFTDQASSLHSVTIQFWWVSQIRACPSVQWQFDRWLSLEAWEHSFCDRMLSQDKGRPFYLWQILEKILRLALF